MDIVLVILGLAILILSHEFGHFSVAKMLKIKVEEFGIGFPPRLFGKKAKSETIYSVNALPFGGFVKLYGEGEEKASDSEAFLNKKFWQKSVVVLAGIVINLLLGWIFLSIVFTLGTPEHLMISSVSPGSPAAQAGVKEGDIVQKLTIDNVTLSDPIVDSDFVSAIKNSTDRSLQVTLLRGNKSIAVNLEKRLNPPSGQGTIGVGLTNIGAAPKSIPKSLSDAAVATAEFSWLILGGLWSLITGIFANPNIIKNVAGPVGIISLASQATSLGLAYLLQLLALISVNLAVLNLIPFPALDGGRFLVFLIEKIKGRKISTRIQLIINGTGFALLILLMIFVTVNDVRNLFVN